MMSAQSLSDRFLVDFRSRFLPLIIGSVVLLSGAIGYYVIGNVPEKPVATDAYVELLRTGVVDVTRPSPTNPNITEVVRFLPDGRVQVLERMQTKHFLSAGGRPPPQRAQGVADTPQKR